MAQQWNSIQQWKWTNIHNNEQKKADTKAHHDSICTKFKFRQNSSIGQRLPLEKTLIWIGHGRDYCVSWSWHRWPRCVLRKLTLRDHALFLLCYITSGSLLKNVSSSTGQEFVLKKKNPTGTKKWVHFVNVFPLLSIGWASLRWNAWDQKCSGFCISPILGYLRITFKSGGGVTRSEHEIHLWFICILQHSLKEALYNILNNLCVKQSLCTVNHQTCGFMSALKKLWFLEHFELLDWGCLT